MSINKNVPAALVHLADKLRESAANDAPESRAVVMTHVAGSLRAIAILAKS